MVEHTEYTITTANLICTAFSVHSMRTTAPTHMHIYEWTLFKCLNILILSQTPTGEMLVCLILVVSIV
jgi:hypothetical protein